MTTRPFDARRLWADDAWRFSLDPDVLDELRRLPPVEALAATPPDAARHPALARLARAVRSELLHGSGVAWIRGLPVADFDREGQRRCYLALALGLGQPDLRYGLLYDVIDRGQSHTERAIPVSMTRAESTFHTDSSARASLPDLVGLLCLVPARQGGRSQVSSALAAHEQLAARRPDLLRALYRDFMRDVVAPGLPRTDDAVRENRFPIFARAGGSEALTFRYMRYWIERGHERVGAPLAADEREAFDVLDATLASPQQVVEFDLEPGEMLWVNNRTIAHNRTSFEDGAEPRHLVRMWLECA